jgi:hypothetical protein
VPGKGTKIKKKLFKEEFSTLMASSRTFEQSLAVTLVVDPRAGDELISSSQGCTEGTASA